LVGGNPVRGETSGFGVAVVDGVAGVVGGDVVVDVDGPVIGAVVW
jgi:hypothetical protein